MVAEEEELYRRVPRTAGPADCYKVEPDGKVRFTVAAFLDRAKRPSVDRAALRNHNPHPTRASKEDGITSLIAGAVRKIGVIEKKDDKGKVLSEHAVDVVAAPVEGNNAHAEIILSPEVGGKAFERLKEALSRLATERGWVVEPGADMPAA
jgi:hypothetical protein